MLHSHIRDPYCFTSCFKRLLIFCSSLELLEGDGRGCFPGGSVVEMEVQFKQLLVKHLSRSSAKSVMLKLVPAAVCYLIFRQSLKHVSGQWVVSNSNLKQIYLLSSTCVFMIVLVLKPANWISCFLMAPKM